MFITAEEFTTHIYGEIIGAISREDSAKVLIALKAAEQQAAAYLSRFDIEAIYSSEGEEKEKYLDLATYIKDIAKFHFIKISNASIDYEVAESGYKAAIKELEKLQNGRLKPLGWPLAVQPQGASGQFHITSRKKRGNHY